MILKLFGILDMVAWISLVLFQFGVYKSLLLLFTIYLIIKGLLFLPGLTSTIDIITGIFFLMAFFGIFSILTWILFIFLIQKSFFTLLI